jgi:hypothetical protein
MVDLFSVALTAAADWTVRRALEVIVRCNVCRQPNKTTVNNGNRNHLTCRNCAKSLDQYTNACNFTVQKDGEIAHVGLDLATEHQYLKKFCWTHLKTESKGIFVPGTFRFVGLKGRSVVEENFLRHFDSNAPIAQNDFVWTPKSNDCQYSMRLDADISDVDQTPLEGKVLCLETTVRSRFGDVLFTDRDVFKFTSR